MLCVLYSSAYVVLYRVYVVWALFISIYCAVLSLCYVRFTQMHMLCLLSLCCVDFIHMHMLCLLSLCCVDFIHMHMLCLLSLCCVGLSLCCVCFIHVHIYIQYTYIVSKYEIYLYEL
jgi:hypothetical protein